jgi:hypothetical protein
MLSINFTGTSSVCIYLYDKCQNQINPYFTWQLVRSGSFDNIIFTATDISSDPNIYSRFVLTVGVGDLTQGVIPVQSGQYTYTIYEMVAPGDLNLNNNIGVIDIGTFNVLQNPIVSIPAFNAGATQSFDPSVSPIPVFRPR